MNTKQKAELIGAIIAHLRLAAQQQKKAFDEGDAFLALCFKADGELLEIAELAGC